MKELYILFIHTNLKTPETLLEVKYKTAVFLYGHRPVSSGELQNKIIRRPRTKEEFRTGNLESTFAIKSCPSIPCSTICKTRHELGGKKCLGRIADLTSQCATENEPNNQTVNILNSSISLPPIGAKSLVTRR